MSDNYDSLSALIISSGSACNFATADTTPTKISSKPKGFAFEKGETNDWLTPPELVELLGNFDLDPCGCAGMPWRTATTTYFLPEHDGLVEAWHGRVFCNPPYGTNVGDWAIRMAEHGNGLMLIFARTETNTWQKDIFPLADAILFLNGRVHFYLPSGERGKSGTAPSVLLAYGQENVEALRKSSLAGAFYSKAEMLVGIKASQL